jgi:hypothetical protein
MRFLLVPVLVFVFLILGLVVESSPFFVIDTIGTAWKEEGIFITPNTTIKLNGCKNSRFRVDTTGTHLLQNEMLSFLLSAYHSGSKVQIYVTECFGDDMKVQAVKLAK